MKTAAAGRLPEARQSNLERIEDATLKLFAYCRREEWSGYDPYDALNSKLLARLPIIDAKWPRIFLTQLLKRSPINLRPVLQIPKTENPKTLALSLLAVIKLGQLGLIDEKALIGNLVSRVEATRSSSQYWCWGYSFPWQGRSLIVRRGEPNLVCTTFVADAMIDLFEETGDPRYLAMAESAGRYLLDELFWQEGKTVASFGYPAASARSRVHNANLLAAAFLLRLYRYTGDEKANRIAREVATYSGGCQRPDGSWPYGELASQQWIDNFHTGYNLWALRRIAKYGETTDFDQSIDQGYQFYRQHFFRTDGAPRYFHNRTYPIDVHCVAQSVITLLEFAEEDPTAMKGAENVLTWALDNLWDARGYFYYQKARWGTNTISYMRWGQAWMLLALAEFLQRQKPEAKHAC